MALQELPPLTVYSSPSLTDTKSCKFENPTSKFARLSFTVFLFSIGKTQARSRDYEIFSCSTQLSMKFSLLINMKMFGIFIFISREMFMLSYV